jgi:RND family efflux transporter MFP subunit
MGNRKKIWKGLLGVGIAIITVIIYLSVSNAPVKLTVEAAERNHVKEVVDVSGNIESENVKAYYSTVTAVISQLSIKRGDSVKAGDQLLSYNTKDFETAVEQAKLGTRASETRYQSAINNNAKNSMNYKNAATSLAILEQQIADEKDCISSIQEALTSVEVLASEITAVSTKMASTIDTKELKKLQNELDNLQEEYDRYDVASLSGDLAYHQTELTQCLTSQSEYKAQQKTADASLIDSAAKNQLKTAGEAAKITQTQTEEELEKASQGLTAEFDGIVTVLDIEEGAFVSEGMKLLVVESSTEFKVTVNVSKYDIGKIELGQKAKIHVANQEYNGIVSKINRMADVDTSDKPEIAVEIHIENPDDKIYIGLEADVTIDTEEKADVLTVSSLAVYTDDEGDYCYSIENGVVEKKYITKGIESDILVEVLDGLTEGEQVITGSITDDSIGKKAVALK